MPTRIRRARGYRWIFLAGNCFLRSAPARRSRRAGIALWLVRSGDPRDAGSAPPAISGAVPLSRFLARLAARITTGEKSLAPRPCHRFGDAPSMPAGGPLSAQNDLITGTSVVSGRDAPLRSPSIRSGGTSKFLDSSANSLRGDELSGPAFED